MCVLKKNDSKSLQNAHKMKGNFVLVILTSITDSLRDKSKEYAITSDFHFSRGGHLVFLLHTGAPTG